jgi:hypothetical protein
VNSHPQLGQTHGPNEVTEWQKKCGKFVNFCAALLPTGCLMSYVYIYIPSGVLVFLSVLTCSLHESTNPWFEAPTIMSLTLPLCDCTKMNVAIREKEESEGQMR